MGNINHQTKQNQIVDVELSHPQFANSKLIKVDSNTIHVQTIVSCQQKAFLKWKSQIASANSSPEYLLIPEKWDFSIKNICGSTGHVTLNFPYFPYLLTEQIYNRLGKKSRFEEPDLWYLLFSLSAAKQEIQKYGLNQVGDLRCLNVFLNDEGKVKIKCSISWPNETTLWEKALDHESVYMAPEDFEQLRNGEIQSQSLSSQMFAIGQIMINSGLLVDETSVSPISNFKQMKFNHEQYNRRVNQWVLTRGYSEILKATILNLFSISPENRISNQELWGMLKLHKQEIKDRKNFVINNAPIRLHQEVVRFRQIKSKLKASNLQSFETSTIAKHEIAQTFTPPVLIQEISKPLNQDDVQGQQRKQSETTTIQGQELKGDLKVLEIKQSK